LKRVIGALFLLWTCVLIAAYYIVQKPGLLNVLSGLVDTVWTLLVAAILLFNAYGLGRRALNGLRFDHRETVDHLLIAEGTGLGVLGLLGLFFAAIQLANPVILTIFQFLLAVLFLLQKDLNNLIVDIHRILSYIQF